VNSRNAATAWWQHHKHCPGIIIIIINSVTDVVGSENLEITRNSYKIWS